MLAARLGLGRDEAARRAALAQEAAAALAAARGARRVALYAPVRGEVDTAALHARLRAAGVVTAYPVVSPGRPGLTFHAVDDPGRLRPGAYGIPAPDPESAPEVPLETLDLIVVPGLAFDRAGRRLGYGGGYYDRTVGAVPAARLVGLAFAFQVVDRLPAGAHDLVVGALATDAGLVELAAEHEGPAGRQPGSREP